MMQFPVPVSERRRLIEPTPGQRVCFECGVEQPVAGFGQRQHAKGTCNGCFATKSRAQRAKDPEGSRTYFREKRREYRYADFGITPAQYAAMLHEQHGVCAICKQVDRHGRALAVDHDHSTGRIRGLLCTGCNRGIGLFSDDPIRLQAAATYLEVQITIA